MRCRRIMRGANCTALWLGYRGAQVPVFDLGLFLGDEPTPLLLSSRIMLFTRLHDAKQRVGLLAADIIDTKLESELQGAELLQPEPAAARVAGRVAMSPDTQCGRIR